VARFLERYSELGGTHHAALVCGVPLEAIAAFADYAGLPLHTLEGD
jgi:L-arabinose isomerase